MTEAAACSHLECECHRSAAPARQNLEEIAFGKSACAAAQAGNCSKLRDILSKNPASIHTDGADGSSGYTPLHFAARAGHLEAVKILLNAGVDPNSCIKSSKASSLHRAAYAGHTDVAKALISKGADAILQDADGETALHKAASQGHVETATFLKKSQPKALLLLDRNNKIPASVAKDEAAFQRVPAMLSSEDPTRQLALKLQRIAHLDEKLECWNGGA